MYADDTLLVMNNSTAANYFLASIENESAYYNTKLNQDKCVYIPMIKTTLFILVTGKVKHSAI